MGDNRPAPELRDCARLPSPPRFNPIARSQTGTLTLPRAGSGAQSLRKASALESSVRETNENRRWTGVLSHQAAGRRSPWRGLPPAGHCETRPVPGRLPRPPRETLNAASVRSGPRPGSNPVPVPVPVLAGRRAGGQRQDLGNSRGLKEGSCLRGSVCRESIFQTLAHSPLASESPGFVWQKRILGSARTY